jgi:hypothetical protein
MDDGMAFGKLSEHLVGAQRCRTYADGTAEQPSCFCWLWLSLMVVTFAASAVASVRQAVVEEDRARKARYGAAGALSVLVGLVNLYIFYGHCARCNGWTGFFATLLIGVVSSIVIGAIAPPSPMLGLPGAGRVPGSG